MAVTHTEVYRPFRGRLRERRFHFWPLVAVGIQVALKRKLPLLLLFFIPAVQTAVFSFVVNSMYGAEQALWSEDLAAPTQGLVRLFARRALENVEVSDQILQLTTQLRFFAFLVIVWYGSGLFAEDRRLGAHQLYFARPLSRFDYFLAKFLTCAFFGACAILLPCLVICVVATFSSTDWEFLREDGDVILRSAAYAGIWIALLTSVTLAVSSLVRRKTFALVASFGLVVMTDGIGLTLNELVGRNLRRIGFHSNMRRVGAWLFGKQEAWQPWAATDSLLIVLGLTAAALAVVALRLRRLEVVA